MDGFGTELHHRHVYLPYFNGTTLLTSKCTHITTTLNTGVWFNKQDNSKPRHALFINFMTNCRRYCLVSGEDTVLGDQTYRYLTADEMKSLGDDSLPIDVTRDERIDSNKVYHENMLPPQHIEDSFSPEHIQQNYIEYIKKYVPDNVDINKHPINIG